MKTCYYAGIDYHVADRVNIVRDSQIELVAVADRVNIVRDSQIELVEKRKGQPVHFNIPVNLKHGTIIDFDL